MQTFQLNLIFGGIDLEDDDTFDALAVFPEVAWRSRGPVAWAIATIEAASAIEAAKMLIRRIIELVPTARPMRLDEDLVAIPDIAERVGVTREAVRNWANGARQSNFPPPRGIIGDKIKVWRWAEVSGWLGANLHIGDGTRHPSELEFSEINVYLARLRDQIDARSASQVDWVVTQFLSSEHPSIAQRPSGATAWTGAGKVGSAGELILGSSHAVA